MRKRTTLLIAIIFLITVVVNIFTYSSLINGSGTMLSLVRKLNYAFVTPKTYLSIAKKLQRKPQNISNNVKQQEDIIFNKSFDFIEAAFQRDGTRVKQMLDPAAKYISSKDGSSFIRYIENGVHVEGYMATDKKLIKAKGRWQLREDDQTITCSMEVYTENQKAPELWYIHFRKVKNDWRVYMLENNI